MAPCLMHEKQAALLPHQLLPRCLLLGLLEETARGNRLVRHGQILTRGLFQVPSTSNQLGSGTTWIRANLLTFPQCYGSK